MYRQLFSEFNMKIAMFFFIVLYFITHMYEVIRDNSGSLVYFIESGVMLSVSYYLLREIIENRNIKEELKNAHYKNKSISEGLQALIDDKFNEWGLTTSEKDVASLLIQGRLIKEIAYKRNVSEKTVQAQLTSIYKKSETRNRPDFTTRFIGIIYDHRDS